MPKASRDSLGNKGKTDLYYFDPEDVILVEDDKSVLYDERVDNDFRESLVANMMYAPDGTPLGVLKACIGRRHPESGKIEIVDGRQRTKAAREANKRLKKQGAELLRLPVLLKRASDVRLMATLISANEHATDDSPMGRAKKMQRFIDLGRGEDEVAQLFGISVASVKNMLRLLDAPAAVRHAVDSGKITASDGYKLAREEPEVAKKTLGKLLEQAPRVPGKKRSKNARKARAIMGETVDVAEAIAAWVEENWGGGNWDGAPSEIPKRIRAGEWRKEKGKEAAE